MEFSSNPNPKCTEKPQASTSMHPFSDVPSFSKMSKPTGQIQKIGKQCFLPPLSFKISLRDISFYISLNSLGFYLSRMVVKFSLTCIFQLVWEKFFNLWCSHSQKIIESMLFCSYPSPPLKTPGIIFCFPQDRKGWEEAMICSIKILSENMKMAWNISLFPFGMIALFLNVMGLQFWK